MLGVIILDEKPCISSICAVENWIASSWFPFWHFLNFHIFRMKIQLRASIRAQASGLPKLNILPVKQSRKFIKFVVNFWRTQVCRQWESVMNFNQLGSSVGEWIFLWFAGTFRASTWLNVHIISGHSTWTNGCFAQQEATRSLQSIDQVRMQTRLLLHESFRERRPHHRQDAKAALKKLIFPCRWIQPAYLSTAEALWVCF